MRMPTNEVPLEENLWAAEAFATQCGHDDSMNLDSRHKQRPVKRLLDRYLHGSRRGVDVNDHLRLLLVRALGGCLNFHVN